MFESVDAWKDDGDFSAGIWCHHVHINVHATSSHRIDVNTTSFLRHIPAGLLYYKLILIVISSGELKGVSDAFSRYFFTCPLHFTIWHPV